MQDSQSLPMSSSVNLRANDGYSLQKPQTCNFTNDQDSQDLVLNDQIKNHLDGGPHLLISMTGILWGKEVIQAVTHFFSSSRLLRATNAFFITLLPNFITLLSKTLSLISFSNFRPINLLNFTYKIKSKILAKRLSIILPPLISNHQSTFVKGWSIHHHIALTHDLFQKLKSKMSGGSVCMKLDIAKVFDRIQWSFLFKALKYFNFSQQWINIITELVCSSRASVLVNKSPSSFFSSSCGLRQGCLLSPFLSILAEEILSLKIERLRLEGFITSISSVPISPCHLLYADDILIFLKAHKRGLRRLS